MRNFHVHSNTANQFCPAVNLDKLWTLVSEGVELDRLDGGVFAILDTITEAVAKLDLAGEWGCILYPVSLYLVICCRIRT